MPPRRALQDQWMPLRTEKRLDLAQSDYHSTLSKSRLPPRRRWSMSFRLAGKVWDVGEITSSQKLVLLAMADTASDDGRCWPGRKYLAKKCGMDIRTLDRNLNSLVKRGLLKKTQQKRENGSCRSSLYQIFPSSPAQEEAQEEGEANCHQEGGTTPSEGRQNATRGEVNCRPLNLFLNLSLNLKPPPLLVVVVLMIVIKIMSPQLQLRTKKQKRV